MTNYKFLCNYTGAWSMPDRNGDLKKGISYYLIVCKEGCCKPTVYGCSKDVFDETSKFKLEEGTMINMFFDERQKVSGVKTS